MNTSGFRSSVVVAVLAMAMLAARLGSAEEKITFTGQLVETSAKPSYGIVVDGKLHTFDKRGNELAKAALARSSSPRVATFTVIAVLSTSSVDRASIPGPNGVALMRSQNGFKILVPAAQRASSTARVDRRLE